MMERTGHLFLTGATGHTGSRAARRLLEDGWRLRCLSHNPEHTAHLPRDPNLEIVQGDIREPAAWAEALGGAAALVNMAHVGFAQYVVEACASAGVRRAISFSSTRRFTRFPEETARLVIAGEAALDASDLDYTILRPAMIFGGERDNNLEKLVRWLRRRRWMPLLAGGRNLVQPIYTWDLVDALARALERPEATRRRALTLAGPRPMTQRAMIETLARLMGRPLVWMPVPYAAAWAGAGVVEIFMRRRPFVTRDQVRRMLEDKAFDIGEAQEALGGWQPREFEAAIKEKLAGRA